MVTCPYTTLMLFGMPLYTLLLLLLRSPRNPFRSRSALHAICGGLVAINAFWFLHSLGDGTLFIRHGLFGATSARAARDNPLLPAPTSCPPYHSWIFEPRKGRVRRILRRPPRQLDLFFPRKAHP